MRVSFKTLMTAGLSLAGSMIVQPAPAEAQPYWGPHYRAGWGYRPYAYAPRAYYGPRYYGGYRSVYYGPRRHYGYPYRTYRRSNGGAIAAGLIGGLALGPSPARRPTRITLRPITLLPAASSSAGGS
jgi:hypothetical protein